MKQITLSVINKGTTLIAPFSETYGSESMPKAVGKAMTEAWTRLTKQYDAPEVTIGGMTLTDAQVKKLWKVSFLDFNVNFPVLRETIIATLALVNEADRVDYIRHTDITGHFKGTKSFTLEQVAVQAKQQLKKTRFATTLAKEDAKMSVWTPAQLQALEYKQEAAKQKRIEAKKQQQLA